MRSANLWSKKILATKILKLLGPTKATRV
jgi:hypothetical protein